MSSEEAHLKMVAKLEVLRSLREELDKRICELEKALRDLEHPEVGEAGTKARPASKAQVDYLRDLVEQLNFKVHKPLEQMTREEASNLISYLKKKKGEGKTG
ncbi:MAG: hypothetical protein QW566_11520 [Candidatus Jordarchaeales archaeon]